MSSKFHFLGFCLWSAVAMLWKPLQAGELQSLAQIQASAEQHLHTLLGAQHGTLFIEAAELDTRLRLAACPAALEVFLPSGANIGSRVTTGVRCTQGTQWTLYVPVNVAREVATLVLNKALARGAPVTANDVETRLQRIPGLSSDYLKTTSELSGKRLKRAVPAGTALNPAMFEAEILIRRGQQVTVVAAIGGIEVRSQGVAMNDGSASSRIQVKNTHSAKVVEGFVDSSSVVRINL